MPEDNKQSGPTINRYKLYEKDDGKLKKNIKFCPKCGKGVALAQHDDRLTCGKCGYMEKLQKKE